MLPNVHGLPYSITLPLALAILITAISGCLRSLAALVRALRASLPT